MSLRRVFVASVATETNTFSPLRSDLIDFHEGFYAAPGQHPSTPTLCSAVFPVARDRAETLGWQLIEGTATWAEPGGVLNAHTWETLRDQLLDELRAALPLDIVLLGLHGAMVAEGCLDCEGELLACVREVVGPDVIVAATLDPHSHLSERRTSHADLLIAFKEFPHTDFVDTAEQLVTLVDQMDRGDIRPVMSAFDCRMIDVLPTSQEPMRSYIDRLMALEGQNDIVSISVIHGFMAGDVPDLGAKLLVISNDNAEQGDQLAEKLGMELFGLRGTTRPDGLTPEAAITKAMTLVENRTSAPVVLADIWDNPGGGVPGDSTILLRAMLAHGVTDAALATLWDPIATRLCFSAGVDATLPLRFGGKVSSTGGDPIDATVTVKNLVRNASMSFGASVVSLGDAAWINVNGIDVILNTARTQVYDPDVFSHLGIDPLSRRMLVVKSTNHFFAAFNQIASDIVYVDVEGPYPSNPATNDYKHLSRDIWPRVENPFDESS